MKKLSKKNELKRFELTVLSEDIHARKKIFVSAKDEVSAMNLMPDNVDVSVSPASLYSELMHEKIDSISFHESDLYVPVTEKTIAILEHYPLQKANATTFKSNLNGKLIYDIPFAYQPYWNAKQKQNAEKREKKESTAPVAHNQEQDMPTPTL